MFLELKDKYKHQAQIHSNIDTLLSQLAYMFNYDGFDTLDTAYIELYLNVFGCCAFWKNNGKLIVSHCTRSGAPNEIGLGNDLICTTSNGISVTFRDFENNRDVVYCKNDLFAMPDTYIERFGELLGEIDTSLVCIIKNTRLAPLLEVPDERSRKAFEKVRENILNGIPSTIVSDNIFSEKTDVKQFTQVEHTNKIQYLMSAIEGVNRRFWNVYGLNYDASQKQAQQTVAETQSGSNSRSILPYERLDERKKAMEKIKDYFGITVSVDFSEPWKNENENVSRETFAENEKEVKNNDDIQNLGTVEE